MTSCDCSQCLAAEKIPLKNSKSRRKCSQSRLRRNDRVTPYAIEQRRQGGRQAPTTAFLGRLPSELRRRRKCNLFKGRNFHAQMSHCFAFCLINCVRNTLIILHRSLFRKNKLRHRNIIERFCETIVVKMTGMW